MAQEIVEVDGEATVLTARRLEGLSDSAVIALLHAAPERRRGHETTALPDRRARQCR